MIQKIDLWRAVVMIIIAIMLSTSKDEVTAWETTLAVIYFVWFTITIFTK